MMRVLIRTLEKNDAATSSLLHPEVAHQCLLRVGREVRGGQQSAVLMFSTESS